MRVNKVAKFQGEFLHIYDNKLSLWPVPYEAFFVDTSYGNTHVIASGSQKNPPLILLPGLAVTSMMWLPNISALSRHFQCYLVDVIGDHGRSQLDHPSRYPRFGKDYSKWLKQVYRGLGITAAFLLGASNGGYAAINHALYEPDQVLKLVLLAPSGLDLTLRKVLPRIFYYLAFPSDNNRKALIDWLLGDDPNCREAFGQQLWWGMQKIPKVPIPILISGNRLKDVQMPVMIVLGENDPTISVVKGSHRVRKYMPTADLVVIPGVGHVLNIEAGEQIEQMVIDFLNGKDF